MGTIRWSFAVFLVLNSYQANASFVMIEEALDLPRAFVNLVQPYRGVAQSLALDVQGRTAMARPLRPGATGLSASRRTQPEATIDSRIQSRGESLPSLLRNEVAALVSQELPRRRPTFSTSRDTSYAFYAMAREEVTARVFLNRFLATRDQRLSPRTPFVEAPTTPVPLPAGVWLLLSGIGLAGLLRRRADAVVHGCP